MITLGVVQAAACSDVKENLRTIRRYVDEARQAGCGAVCFPEGFLTGYTPQQAAERALRRDSPLMEELASLAREGQVDLLVGFMEQEEGRYFLTHGVWRADGTAGFYRKTHLGVREEAVFCPGDRLDIFSLSCGLRVGIQLCVEAHFPEITQTYALRGADVIFSPHAVPHGVEKRRRLWEKYIPARGYDNRVYMACCNLWDGGRFGGGCMAADPQGNIIAASFENRPGLLCFQVDVERLRAYRRQNHHYYPQRRRPELYQSEQNV